MFVCLGDSRGMEFANMLLVSTNKVLIFDTEDETIEEVLCGDLIKYNIHVENLIPNGRYMKFRKYHCDVIVHKQGHVVKWGWRYLKVNKKLFLLSMRNNIFQVNGVDLLSISFGGYNIHVRVFMCQIYGSQVLVRFLFNAIGSYTCAIYECVVDTSNYDIAVWRQLHVKCDVEVYVIRQLDDFRKSKLDMVFGTEMG